MAFYVPTNKSLVLFWLPPWASAEIFPKGDNVNIFLIIFRLMVMQCKWTLT